MFLLTMFFVLPCSVRIGWADWQCSGSNSGQQRHARDRYSPGMCTALCLDNITAFVLSVLWAHCGYFTSIFF